MHDRSVENPGIPSREASSEEPYLTELFGPVADSPSAPGIICDLVGDIVTACGAAPEAVTAVAIGTLAAALGPKVVLQGRSRTPVSLNVVVSHQAPRTLPWVDVITAPFTGRVFDTEADLIRQGVAGIETEITGRRAEFEQAGRTVRPNPELLARLEADVNRGPARLKPFVVTSSVRPKEFAPLFAQSFDGGITIVTAGGDPGSDLLQLKPADRACLTELLNRSWSGTPLAIGETVYPGNVSLLWQTRCPVKELLGDRGFSAARMAIPALFLDGGNSVAPVPEFASEAGWRRVIHFLFDHRCLNQETVFTWSPAAAAVFAAFANHIAKTMERAPAALRPHIAWLPEMASRVAAIFWILGEHAALEIDEQTASDAVETTRWIARQHLSTIASVTAPDTAAATDRAVPMLAKIRLKEPLSRRELWGSYDHPKAAWFEPALASLLSSKAVAYNEREQLVTAK